MSDSDIIAQYNYPAFTREAVLPMLRFEESPPLGQQAPDFPLQHLDARETRLSELWSAHDYTVVEFGSFT